MSRGDAHRSDPDGLPFIPFDVNPCPMISIDASGLILQANPAFLRLIGRSHDEIVRCMTFQDLLSPDERFDPLILDTGLANSDTAREVRLPAGDSIRYVRIQSVSIPGCEARVLSLDDRTRIRELEETLRSSKERYRNFFENIQDVYYESTIDGVLLDISPSVSYMSRYTRTELIGKCVTDLYADPEERARFLTILLNQHFINDFELLLKDKTGKIVPCSINARLVFDDNAVPVKLIGTLRDITMRKLHEESIRSTMLELDAIFMNSFVGIVFEVEGVIRKVNQRANEIFGYGLHELICAELRRLHLDETLFESFLNQSGQSLRAGRIAQLEFPLRRKDGTLLQAQINGKAIDPRDPAQGVVWLIDDVTGQRVAEDALHQSEEMFRTISTSALDAIIMMDHSGDVVFWNPAAQRMFGYSEIEIIGKNLHDVLAPDRYRSKYRRGIEGFTRNGQGDAIGRILELEALRKDGSEFPIEIALAALHRNGAWWAIAIVRDITERRQSQKELLRSKQELENAIRHAERLAIDAQRANSAKSDFLANMSHEIRTPMNGIIGMADLMSETILSHDQREYLGSIRKSADTMLLIINDILDFSKIEAGRMRIEQESFDLDVMMDEWNDFLAIQAQEKHIEYLCRIDPETPASLLGDPLRIRQILTNFVTNAIKFTPEGGVIEIRVGRAGRFIRFSVHDTGIGIADDVRDRLFEPFVQADTSTTRRFGGTGLGLAISKRLAGLMGGSVGCESHPGEGSVFWTELPLESQADSGAPLRDLIRLDLTGCAIAIVGMVDRLNRSVADQLARWNAETETLDPAAFDRASGPWDVILIDAPSVTHSTGLSALLESSEAHRPGLVLLQTMFDRKSDKPIAGRADAVITKPVKSSQLSETLRKLLHLEPEVGTTSVGTGTQTRGDAEMGGRVIRILYAEDNAINQNLMIKLVERMGHHIDVVCNGQEAIVALQTAEYDIVLMDVQMPGMDGYTTTQAIRKLGIPGISELPVIAVTAYAMPGDRERCLTSGMTDYIAKPIRLRSFQDLLHKHLRHGI